jgi:hypothetical protein
MVDFGQLRPSSLSSAPRNCLARAMANMLARPVQCTAPM